MAAPGKEFCVLEYHTVSLWLLCNVHFVQSMQRTRLQTRPFVRGINNLLKLGVCASRNQVVPHLPQKNLNIISMCAPRVIRNTSYIYSCQKKSFSVFVWLWTIPLTFWRRNYFFLILAHLVYKMRIIQEPNTLELWNKLHFEEEKMESMHHV